MGQPPYRYLLGDDGTLDTVVYVHEPAPDGGTLRTATLRYSADMSAPYRDESGRLDFSAFVADVVEPDCEAEDPDDLFHDWE